MATPTVTLVVRGAEKRDAGRGVARLPEPARQRLGVLSGDTVLIRAGEVDDRDGNGEDGEENEPREGTVAKVWPASPDLGADELQIDADTRANAGVSIGDVVTVSRHDVRGASSITVVPPVSIEAGEADRIAEVIGRDLRDRPVSEGSRIRIEHLGIGPFVVTSTAPEGTVRITDETRIRVRRDGSGDVPSGVGIGTGTGTGRRRGDAGPATEEGATTVPIGAGRVTYEDIGGLDDELDLVREMIELPLAEPELFHRVGIDPPKGVLLHGPPGTGKTLIARAVANEVDAGFHHVSGPEIMSKYKGESEEQLREVFERARENAPSIVFFDEIDSVAGAREGGGGDVETRIVAQLLSLMDGLDERGDVVVIGATNRLDALDPALRRGGRFDREIEIGVPNEEGRREILEVHTRRMPLAEDVSLERLAERTYGFVGADVHSLATEAGMNALRRHREDRGASLEDLSVTAEDFEAALAAVEPSAMREFVAETPAVGFEDVGGLEEAKAILRESIEWPLRYASLFEATNTAPPSGVLLYGPPGTGKTLLARAVARESGVNFIHVRGPELLDKYVGESERAVRKLFERARQSAPTIVFFDEIDALAGRRDGGAGGGSGGGGGQEVTQRVVSQLLAELDGVADHPHLVVVAATNRKDALDPALLRPGRLEAHVRVPLPDRSARRAILAIHARGKPFGADVDLDDLADRLEGYSGADIEALVRTASMRAIRSVTETHGPAEATAHTDEIRITTEHVEAAMADLDVEPA